MPRIKFIVTGDMEKLALHDSLRRHFPSEIDGDPVIWDVPRKLPCATSHQLVNGLRPSNPMKALARAMLDEVGIGKNGIPADLVLVIDDVELGNLAQEHVVAAHYRAAVETVLDNFNGPTQVRYRKLLREKCSFHLLKPMVEAYLFGDSQALQRAGVSAHATPLLVHPTDVESFESNDPAWLPICHAENVQRQGSVPWWCHERHPKHYLEHLARRSQLDFDYEETRHGKNALLDLDWLQVAGQPTDVPVLRALFEDLADWFQIPNPLGAGNANPCFYPTRSTVRVNLLLRNM